MKCSTARKSGLAAQASQIGGLAATTPQWMQCLDGKWSGMIVWPVRRASGAGKRARSAGFGVAWYQAKTLTPQTSRMRDSGGSSFFTM